MGRKKKEVEIGTFTIVSKAPKGCKRNVVYTVTYQRSGEPEIYNVKMVWLDFRDTPTWAFMDGREADLLTNEERKEFIEEMFKFRKGGSYRKTHPIAYSRIDELKNTIKEKEYEIYEIKKEIDKLEEAELTALCDKYEKYIDNKKIDKFEEGLRNLEEKTGYMLKKKNFLYNTDIVVYDFKNQLPVGVLKPQRGNWVINKFDMLDIRSVIKSDAEIKNRLKE